MPSPLYTFDEYLAHEMRFPDVKWELHNGVIVAMAGGSVEHAGAIDSQTVWAWCPGQELPTWHAAGDTIELECPSMAIQHERVLQALKARTLPVKRAGSTMVAIIGPHVNGRRRNAGL